MVISKTNPDFFNIKDYEHRLKRMNADKSLGLEMFVNCSSKMSPIEHRLQCENTDTAEREMDISTTLLKIVSSCSENNRQQQTAKLKE